MKPYIPIVLIAIAFLEGCATSALNTSAERIDLTPYEVVTAGEVHIAPAIGAALLEHERVSLEREFSAALKDGLAWSQVKRGSAAEVRVDVTITELNASSPTVNLLTTALLFVPLDAGGIAFDARFFEGESTVPFARSTYRHVSTPIELKGSFSRFGHATRSLRDWARGLTSATPGAAREGQQ